MFIKMQGFQSQVLPFLLLTLNLMCVVSGQNAFSPAEISDIEKLTGDVFGCSNIAGMSMGIVRGDATFTTGFGVANMNNGHRVDKNTLFNLGSVSKAFVPYVLAEIMNSKENSDGRIKWNSTLKEILRNDPVTDVPLPWADMNLKDMLVYKSGSSAADMSSMVGLPVDITRQEVVRRLQFLPSNADFRNSNHHSNMMYTVASHLAEILSGMSWANLVKAKVFDKLFMNTSTFATEGMKTDDVARPYRYQNSKLGVENFGEQNITLFNLHPFEPVGSLMSSAEEMTKWLRQLLHNLNAKGNDSGINMLIGDAFHQWVSVPSSHKEGKLGHDYEVALGYGMGWYGSTYRGARRYKYTGSLYAFHSQILLFPELFSAIFVAFSGPGRESAQCAIDSILYYVSDIVLRKSPWVDTDTACSCQDFDSYYENDKIIKNKSKEQTSIKYVVPVEKYIGIFGNGVIGNLLIKLNETGFLIAKIGRNLQGVLKPGLNEFELNFFATSSLISTEEWCNEKTFKFISVPIENGKSIDKSIFHRVRIYLKDNLFYDFERNNLFEIFSDENERKQQDGTISSEHISFINEKIDEKPTSSQEINKHKSDKNGKTLEKEGENPESHHIDNDNLRSGSVSKGHHSHQSDNMEGQGDEPDLNEVKDPSDITNKVHEANKKSASTSKNGTDFLNSTKCLLFVFLLIMVNIY